MEQTEQIEDRNLTAAEPLVSPRAVKARTPLTDAATMAFPNIERDPDIRRLLEHHARIPRLGPAQVILDLVRLGFGDGLQAGLAAEAREFGRIVASEDGRAGLDRFLARKSLPLPLRRDDLS